jgi:hypothetical protein
VHSIGENYFCGGWMSEAIKESWRKQWLHFYVASHQLTRTVIQPAAHPRKCAKSQCRLQRRTVKEELSINFAPPALVSRATLMAI